MIIMSNSTQKYNAAGRLVYDSSHHLCTVNYNTLGLPTLMSPATTSISSSPRKERVYDAHGNKIRQTDIEVTGPAGPKVIADRRYIGSFILNCDTLERVNFGAGYLDSKGKPHFLFTDWQGNVTISTDSRGHIEQHVGYYPYGEPWREPAGQRLNLYGGKERQSGVLTGDYDFGPRSLTFTTLFTSPDASATSYPHLSPWSYCAANPIRNIDPTGNDWVYNETTYQYEWIDGATKDKTPEGFRYVGFSKDDILTDLGFSRVYEIKNAYNIAFGIAGDLDALGIPMGGASVANGVVTAEVLISKGKPQANNWSGIKFDGVRFTGILNQKALYTNSDYELMYNGGMTVSCNGVSGKGRFDNPTQPYIYTTGTVSKEAIVDIPAWVFGLPIKSSYIKFEASCLNNNFLFAPRLELVWNLFDRKK